MNKRILQIMLLVICIVSFSASVFAGPMDDLLLNSVRNNDMTMIKTALANGANINYIKNNADTPLLVAISRTDEVMVDYLLKNGADPNLSISNFSINKIPLIEASKARKNLKIAQLLVNAGAQIDVFDDAGYTPLMHAVTGRPNVDMIRLYLSKSADVNHESKYGMTSLMIAAEFQNGWGEGYSQSKLAAANILLKAGADTSKVNQRGKTALQYAIDSHFVPMINLLMPISPK